MVLGLCLWTACEHPAQVGEVLPIFKTRAEAREWLAQEKLEAASFRESGALRAAKARIDQLIHRLEPQAEHLNMVRDLGWLYAGKAYIESELEGSFLLARQNYMRAEHCFRSIDSVDFETGRFVLEPLGNIYTRLGDPSQAEVYLKQFYELASMAEDTAAMADACNDMGIALMEALDFEQSQTWLQRGLELSRVPRLQRGLLTSNSARLHLVQEEWSAARQWGEQALLLFSTHDDKRKWVHRQNMDYRLGTLNILIESAGALGDAKAVHILVDSANAIIAQEYDGQQSRKLAKADLAAGNAFLKLQNHQAALASFQHALEILIPGFTGNAHAALPASDRLYPEHLIGDALIGKIAAFNQQIIVEGGENLIPVIFAHYDAMFALEAQVRSELLASESRLSHSAAYARVGREAVDFAHRLYVQHRQDSLLWKAFSYAESSKGFLLSEALRTSWITASEEQATVLSELRQVRQQIATWWVDQLKNTTTPGDETTLDELRLKEARLKDALAAESPALYRQLYAPNHLSADAIGTWADKRSEALLTGFAGDSTWYMFCLTETGLQVQTLAVSKDLKSDIEQFVEACQRPGKSTPVEFHKMGHGLYQALLGPFKTVLMNHERWTFIPDGLMASINLELLSAAGGTSTSYRDIPYLLQTHTIHYAPSLAFLMRPLSQHDFVHDLAQFRPTFDCDTALAPLSGIAIDDWNGSALNYEGTDANTTAFGIAAGKARIIHLATHGLASGQHPGDSWIAFADSAGCQHQRLYFPQLQAADLRAELVVLQACQSGKGRYASGEGVQSVSHSFMHAGCANVVSSAWDANPATSTNVLHRFYDHLHSSNDASTSLRQAKLDYLDSEGMDEYAFHPYFWSGFVLVGNGHLAPRRSKESSNTPLYILLLAATPLVLIVRGFMRRNRINTET